MRRATVFSQEGGGPAFQNFPEQQFGTSNTQETTSSKVLEKELVSGALIVTREGDDIRTTLTSCPEHNVAERVYDAHFTPEEINSPGACIQTETMKPTWPLPCPA